MPGRSPQLRSRPNLKGFTLIELILVMAMLAIVVALAFPSLKGFWRGRHLDSEARRFLSLTRYGQSRAVSEGAPMMLWLNARERTYGLQAQAGYLEPDRKALEFALAQDLDLDVSLPPASAVALPQTRMMASVNNLPTIRFTPDGFISETSPESIIFREGDNYAVWITQSANRLNYEILSDPPPPSRR